MMTLVNSTMVPNMANVIDGSFFEEIVRTFMELDSRAEATLPCTIYLRFTEDFGFGIPTRLGRLGRFRPCPNCASVAVPTTLTFPLLLKEYLPTDISEIIQLFDEPPLERYRAYRFSYHFCNHHIGRKLFMDFLYWSEPNDIHGPNDIDGWYSMRYGVDSAMCSSVVDRPILRPHRVLQGDVLLDSLAFLNCDCADMAQLVCRSWRRSVDANASMLPLRQFAEVKVKTVAPELCRVVFGLSSVGFAFLRHVSFADLWLVLQTALKRSRIGMLVLNGDIDDYVSFRLLDALSPSVYVEELRLDFRCHHKAETLIALCKKAVDSWKTTVVGLYNPEHTQWIFGDAEITRKLCRLEISVPTIDCRRELDALLFGNPHLEARLQFIYGHSDVSGYPICIEESFFLHYFESVFRRISDDACNDGFVRVLYIRSVFEFFKFVYLFRDTASLPLDDSGFLQKRAVDCETGRAKIVEDDGMKFAVYDAGSETRRYQVFWGCQEVNDNCPSALSYYVITTADAALSGQTQQHRLRFADWLAREEEWEQLYYAKEWMPENRKGAPFEWSHLDFLCPF